LSTDWFGLALSSTQTWPDLGEGQNRGPTTGQ